MHFHFISIILMLRTHNPVDKNLLIISYYEKIHKSVDNIFYELFSELE